jgi:chloride channel protein, CIC family
MTLKAQSNCWAFGLNNAHTIRIHREYPQRELWINIWCTVLRMRNVLRIASRLQREPIYEALAVQDGIHLPSAEVHRRHGRREVIKVMRTTSHLLPAEITVREALEQIPSSEFRTWLVADRRGVVGVINLSRLERELAEGAEKKLGELVDALVFPHVHSDQGLDLALERMGANQIEILPVVSRADIHKLEGIVTLRDVLEAYGVPPA